MTATEQITISGDTVNGLVDSISEAIREGRLDSGEKLPSIRRLAADIGVSPTTVAAAYKELKRRALVEGGQRRRLTVLGESLDTTRVSRIDPFVGAVDLASGNPDPALLPAHEDALRVLADRGFRPDSYGLPVAEDTLARCVRDMIRHVPTDHLAVTSGALDAVERALAAWLRPGDRVVVEDPGYPDVLHLLRVMHLDAVPVAVDDEGPLADPLQAALRAGAVAGVFTPRGQNPTGARLSTSRAAELTAALSSRGDFLVVEDDHLGPLTTADATLTTATQRWAYAHSFTKALGPDLRVAAVFGDEGTITRVSRRMQAGPGWVSHLLQRIVAHVVSDPATRRLLDEAAAAYDARRSLLLRELESRGIRAHGSSGMNAWILVPDEAGVALQLVADGFHVTPGRPFRSASPPGLRVTTAAATEKQLLEFADALASILRGIPGRSA